MIARFNGCRCTERLSALRPPSIGVSEAKMQKSGRKNAPRERRRLAVWHRDPDRDACSSSSWGARMRDRAANANVRTRVSKDEDEW